MGGPLKLFATGRSGLPGGATECFAHLQVQVDACGSSPAFQLPADGILRPGDGVTSLGSGNFTLSDFPTGQQEFELGPELFSIPHEAIASHGVPHRAKLTISIALSDKSTDVLSRAWVRVTRHGRSRPKGNDELQPLSAEIVVEDQAAIGDGNPTLRILAEGVVAQSSQASLCELRIQLQAIHGPRVQPIKSRLAYLGGGANEKDPLAVDFSIRPFSPGEAFLPPRTSLVEIPAGVLSRPKGKASTLRAIVSTVDIGTSRAVAIAQAELELTEQLEEWLWISDPDHLASGKRDYWLSVLRLAFAVAGADGRVEKREQQRIRTFCKMELGTLDPAISEDEKAWFNSTLRTLLKEKPRQLTRGEVSRLLGGALSSQPSAGRASILELCIDVAGADGHFAPQEKILLDHVRESLGVSPAEYRRVFSERFRAEANDKVERMIATLGLNQEPNPDRRRKIVLAETRVWVALQGSPDPIRRAEASRMLALLNRVKAQVCPRGN